MKTGMAGRIAMLLDNPFQPDLRVLREAQSLSRAGYQVTIFAWDRDMRERPQQEVVDQIQVVRIRVKSERQMGKRQIPYYLGYAMRAFWQVLWGKFDIVYCHDFLNLPIGVLLKIFRYLPKPVRLVYDAHEIYSIMEVDRYSPRVLNWMRRCELFLMPWADAFITVGQQRCDYYRQQGYRGEITIVGNWYNPQTVDRAAGQELRQELGIPEHAFVVVQAGTLAQFRAADVIIEAARSAQAARRPIHWIVAGMGSAQEAFEQEAQCNPCLHYLGWVDNLKPVFAASDALIYLMDLNHPYSQYNSPNTLYQSIAWQKPLITVSVGEIDSVLSASGAGLFLQDIHSGDLFAAVTRLSEDEMLYQAIVDKLADLRAMYNWDMAEKRLVAAVSGA